MTSTTIEQAAGTMPAPRIACGGGAHASALVTVRWRPACGRLRSRRGRRAGLRELDQGGITIGVAPLGPASRTSTATTFPQAVGPPVFAGAHCRLGSGLCHDPARSATRSAIDG